MTVSSELRQQLLDLIPSLRAFAMSLSGDAERGDDLVQETLVKAWSNFKSFQEGTNLRAWLFTILRNEFYSQMRKRGREVEDVDGLYAARLSTHAPQLGQIELGELREVLTRIPTDQREALLLVGASGFSYEEAAAICGCAVGTIKSRVNRARARVAQMMHVESELEFGPDRVDEAVVSASR
jgi:RNA polymerase sigma-70 factor, ECF subfamily